MKKKLLLMILAVMLVVAMTPFTATASTKTSGTKEIKGTVTWDGIAMDSSSLPDYVKYDSATDTLTIKSGAHSYTLQNSSALISVSGRLDLTIDVEGDLTVDSGEKESPKLIENGILSTTVKGPGSIKAGTCDIDTAGGISISGSKITAEEIDGDEGSTIDISNGAVIDCNRINTVASGDSNVKISGGSHVTLTNYAKRSHTDGSITTESCSITDSNVSAEGGIITTTDNGNNSIYITMTKPGYSVTSKSIIMSIHEYESENGGESATGGTGNIVLTGCHVTTPAYGMISYKTINRSFNEVPCTLKGYAVTDETGNVSNDIVIGYGAGYPSVGTTVNTNGSKYKVTKSGSTGFETQYLGPVSKKHKTASVGSSVSISGKTFKVTSIASKAFYKNTRLKSVTIGSNVKTIGKNAFYGDKKLKTIKIKSKVLKSVGKNAIKGIYKKAGIKVPKSKYKAYKKVFTKKTGFKKSMKIKKY